MLRQGQAAVQQGMGQMGEQGNAILRQGQTLGEQVQAQAGQFAQQVGPLVTPDPCYMTRSHHEQID